MLAGQVRTASQLNPMGYVSNPIHWWPMLPTPSIATGRAQKLVAVLVILEALPCLSPLILVSTIKHNIIKHIYMVMIMQKLQSNTQYIYIYIIESVRYMDWMHENENAIAKKLKKG